MALHTDIDGIICWSLSANIFRTSIKNHWK